MTRSLCRKSIWDRLLISAILCFGILSGGPPVDAEQPHVLSSTFKGTTSEGKSIRITLVQKGNTVTGNGSIGERVCSLSGITSYHGPIIFTFEDGAVTSAAITLSPEGDTATIQGLGKPMIVNRDAEQVRASTGPFAGSYKGEGPQPVTLTITQKGNLLAGTGFINEKPIAVVGKIRGPNQASGSILFSDESRNAVKATLSGDGRILTINGLGNPIEMRKE